MHHLDSAAGEAEGHGPDGTAAGPVHEIVDLGDDVLGGLGEAGRCGGVGWQGLGVGTRGGGGSVEDAELRSAWRWRVR